MSNRFPVNRLYPMGKSLCRTLYISFTRRHCKFKLPSGEFKHLIYPTIIRLLFPCGAKTGRDPVSGRPFLLPTETQHPLALAARGTDLRRFRRDRVVYDPPGSLGRCCRVRKRHRSWRSTAGPGKNSLMTDARTDGRTDVRTDGRTGG